MNIEYKVINLVCVEKINDLENVIIEVEYELKNGNKSLFETIKLQNPDYSNFIAFNDITEELVINWIKKYINIEFYNQFLNTEIIVTKTLPWIK
jgi:hypothetical protein